jgi:diguanylate cyclase (GGDEF)-like protein
MQRFIDNPVARHLFSEAQDGIAIFDETGTLVAWNAAARAITGWDQAAASKQDLLGKGAGMLEIREGKWVDLRSTALATPGRALRIVLFADASAQVALTEARRHLTEGGFIDHVTQLPGLPIALGHLERAVALGRRDKRAVGVLAVAVDLPRTGPEAPADELMGQLGKRVITATRTSDLAARVGESELLIVLTAMASPHDAAIVAVRLLLRLTQPYVVAERERSATVSVGVASFPTDGDSADAVRAAAREAMTRVRSGGGGYQLASPTTS